VRWDRILPGTVWTAVSAAVDGRSSSPTTAARTLPDPTIEARFTLAISPPLIGASTRLGGRLS
jgi:hypothetical protein